MSKSAPKHFFSQNPSVNSQRTLFDMSKTDTVTLNPDIYYPNFSMLVCPGDTVVLGYSNMIRLLDSLQVPMMDNLYCDTHWWFVAFDNVWDYTKNFFGEKKRPSDPDINSLPIIQFTSNNLPQVGSVYDYFGIPIVGNDYKDGSNNDQPLLTGSFDIQAMPLLSYYLIHDDWIRDEQRQDYLLDTPDFKKLTFAPTDFDLYKRGKRFDYFTSTLLNPTGNANMVNVNLTTTNGDGFIPVIANLPHTNSDFIKQNGSGVMTFSNIDTSGTPPYTVSNYTGSKAFGTTNGAFGPSSASGSFTTASQLVAPDNLSAFLSNSSVSVEVLRRAFQVQAYYETLARYGQGRYTEYLYSMYNVINPDQLLDRAEYLGETHQRLSVQPIVQTADTTNAPLGNLGAIVSGGVSEGVFTRSFTRFGYIIGCINIYADMTYYQGLEKHWSLHDRMDFPLSIFANLTDQPVYKKEIVLTGTSTDDEVFGYQEIYAWAKYNQNSLRGLVRPNAPQSIGYWSLAQKFDSVPVNNDTFITSTTPIDRITSVNTANNVHHFICNQKIDVKLTRELPAHSDPMKWMFRY